MFRQYRPIQKDEFIVAFGDTATGLGDYSCTQFLSKTHLDIPLVYHSPKSTPEMTNAICPVLDKIYDTTGIKPVIAYERNNGGAFEMERVASFNRDGKYEVFKMPTAMGQDLAGAGREEPLAVKLGWDTNTATRPKMLTEFKEAIDKRLLKIYDRPTINECYSFVIVTTSSSTKAQAEKGAHDDLVMSAAGAWQLQQMCNLPLKPQDYQRIMAEFPKQQITNKYGLF